MTKTATTPKLTARMTEALLVAVENRNAKNMHGTYKALKTRGLVEYVWPEGDHADRCWFITDAGRALAATLSK